MVSNYTKRKEEIQIKNLAISNVDCNNYINTGIYYLGSNLTNAPQEYIKLIVLGEDKSVSMGDVFQIAGGVSNNKMYCRNGNFKASEQKIVWGKWQCLTQNITTGTEYETGRIIDDKKEYAKRINCGTLFESGIKTVETGLSNVTYTDIEGICVTSGGGWPYKMGTTGTSALAVLSIDNNQIKIESKGNLSTYTGYVELKYLKN